MNQFFRDRNRMEVNQFMQKNVIQNSQKVLPLKSRNSLLKNPIESKFQSLKQELKITNIHQTTDETEREKYNSYDINAHVKRDIKTS